MRSSVVAHARPSVERSVATDRTSLCWSVLSYRVPAGPSRPRVALWRHLQRRHALNLELGTWAVRHEEDGTIDLEDVVALVADAGGRCSVREVAPGSADTDTAKLEGLLRRACDHLWDAFFNECDQELENLTELPDRHHVAQRLDGLRRHFLEVRRRDLLFTGAGLRASRRLAACYELLDPDERRHAGADGRFSDLVARRPGTPWEVECRPATDGTVTYLAMVTPYVPVVWERAFAAFEAAVYLPAADRVPLEHGMFSFSCHPADRSDVMDTLANRVRVFARAGA